MVQSLQDGNTTPENELFHYKLENTRIWNGEKLSSWDANLAFNLLAWFFPEQKFKKSTWFDFLRRQFFEKIDEAKIHLNEPVTKIDYSSTAPNSPVMVETASGKVFAADKVLVTSSIGVLKYGDIEFVPELSADKKNAIDSVVFLPGFKLVMKFKEKWFPDVISVTGVGEGEKTFLDSAYKKDVKDNVFALLVTGDPAEKYYTLNSDQEIVNVVLKELDTMYGSNIASSNFTGEFILEDWGRKPFIKGTWVEGFKIKASTLVLLNKPLVSGGEESDNTANRNSGKSKNSVYFAGEANDVSRQMGVPGAILSGFDAIDRLLLSP